MRPPPFGYARPADLIEATELLESNERAVVLAGGQTLIAQLNRRVRRPSMLVDVKRVEGLRGVVADAGRLRIGALTTHEELATARDEMLRGGLRVIRQAMRFVNHQPVRVRGTAGGSIMNASARAEWPLIAVLLDATVELVSVAGVRRVRAGELLVDDGRVSAARHELLVSVDIDDAPDCAAMAEFSHGSGNDLALLTAAVALTRDARNRIVDARVVLGGVGGAPCRIGDAEEVLLGESMPSCGGLVPELRGDAARAASRAIDPLADHEASSSYRRQLAFALVERALTEAMIDGPTPTRAGAR